LKGRPRRIDEEGRQAEEHDERLDPPAVSPRGLTESAAEGLYLYSRCGHVNAPNITAVPRGFQGGGAKCFTYLPHLPHLPHLPYPPSSASIRLFQRDRAIRRHVAQSLRRAARPLHRDRPRGPVAPESDEHALVARRQIARPARHREILRRP